MAAQRIIAGESDVLIGGGVESISCVQQEMNQHMIADPWLKEHKPAIYMSMLETAENVAKRYEIEQGAHGPLRRRQPAEGLRRAGSRQVQRRDGRLSP